MSFEAVHPSLWAQTCGQAHWDPLGEGAGEVDVAVLGAGLFGLTAAYLLKKAGLRVAVLEAARVGLGTTGASTAKITAMHGTRYQEILRQHGLEKATLYAEANAAAVETVARIVATEGIDCDLERVPAWVFAEDPEQREAVEREAAVLQQVHLAADLVDDVPLPWPTLGGLRMADQLQVHPCRLLRGLAERVDGGGSMVFENTRALDVQDGLVTTVGGGAVRARQVVVATRLPIVDPGLWFARAFPQRSYGLAARVAPGEVADGQFVNAGSPTRSVRSALVDGKTMNVFVGYSHKVGEGDPEDSYRKLEEWARSGFGLVEVVARWSTQDYQSMDHLPFVGRLQEATWGATGFGGWGLSNGVAAAMLIADMILDRPNLWGPLYDPARLTLPSLGKAAKENVKAAVHMVVDRLPHDLPDDLAPGSGMVVRRASGPVAVYRDLQGQVHERSAACTHMGCVVAWNDAEKSWDCPCHGSRFDRLGAVLDGPAVEDLRPAD